jgi:hypothetical protein
LNRNSLSEDQEFEWLLKTGDLPMVPLEHRSKTRAPLSKFSASKSPPRKLYHWVSETAKQCSEMAKYAHKNLKFSAHTTQ